MTADAAVSIRDLIRMPLFDVLLILSAAGLRLVL